MGDNKPLICYFCKKLIDVNKEFYEEHEGNYYHSDCKKLD
jgi:hypothetical protein